MSRQHTLTKLIGYDSSVGSIKKKGEETWELPTGEVIYGTAREAIAYLKSRGAKKVKPCFMRLRRKRSK